VILPSVAHVEQGCSGRVKGQDLLLPLTLLLLGPGGGDEEYEKAKGGEKTNTQ
jgi:hypothetical protein